MHLIEAWIERHPVLSKLGSAVIVMGGCMEACMPS